MKGKNLLPRYKLSDRMLVLLADVVEKLVHFSYSEQEEHKHNSRNDLEAFRTLGSSDLMLGIREEDLPDVLEAKMQGWKRNSFRLFEQGRFMNPYSQADFIWAHQLLWDGINSEAGCLRRTNVLWPDGRKLAYHAPSAKKLPEFMKALFLWGEQGRKTPAHPLIQAAVMGYALEVLQPFEVGNHIASLFWQAVLLGRWNGQFWNLPFLPVMLQHQDEYNKVMKNAAWNENASDFIEFMLECYLRSLDEEESAEKKELQVSRPVQALMEVLGEKTLSTKEMMEGLHLRHRPSFRTHYLLPALQAGLVEMTIPDKPNSCRQKYRRKN